MPKALVALSDGTAVLPKVVAAALAGVLVLGAFGWQAWDLWQIRRGRFLDDSQLRIAATAARTEPLGLEAIAALHLFGNPADKPVAPPQPAELPKTDLKLVLVGAITDTDPAKASALIEADRQTKRYFVGDTIPGGAVLHEVLPDSVVLRRDRRYETLDFPKGGEMNPEARENIARLTAQPGAPAKVTTPPPAEAPAARAPAVAAPGNTPAEKKGLSFRERFKQQPRNKQNSQKPAQ